MAATAQPLLPFDDWTDGITQPDVVVNDNSRRAEVIASPAVSFSAAQPGSPAEGDVYIIDGAWGDEVDGTLAYYFDGAWTYWIPFDGMVKVVAGSEYEYTEGSTAWAAVSAGVGDVVGPASSVDDRIATFDGITGKLLQDGGAKVADLDTRGKQAIYIGASGFTPNISGGPANVAAVAFVNANILTMNFDPSVNETAYAWFVLPEKWNGGTITYRVHWSHPATATNFDVVWRLWATALGNDDALDAALGTAVDVTDTGGTTDDLYISDESAAITVNGSPAGGKLVLLRFRRRGAEVADTLAVDARLHGVTIYVTTDQSTDV
jgi:hypothetical protein